MVSAGTSQQESPGFTSGTLASSYNPESCKLGVRLIGHSKWVGVDGCLSTYVSLEERKTFPG